jgi:hypothetical protein
LDNKLFSEVSRIANQEAKNRVGLALAAPRR